MPTYQWRCKECAEEIDILASIQNRDVPPEDPCPYCEQQKPENWTRLMGAPAVMNAALPDGSRRKGFREGVESFRLESEAFNHPAGSAERKRILRESKKLKETK